MFGQGKSFDMLICEKMNFRPAEKWITRNRNWPDSKDIHIMKAQGCHIVPKPTSSRDETSWRLSFSKQEVYLSSLVPMPARYSYMALKLIFKKFWKSKCRVLKSYHVKTWFYWFMESKKEEYWYKENPMYQVFQLFEFFYEELGKGTCKHLFIPEINLLSNDVMKDVLFVRKQLMNFISSEEKFEDTLLSHLDDANVMLYFTFNKDPSMEVHNRRLEENGQRREESMIIGNQNTIEMQDFQTQ